ncbi:NUDIX hydrolase [Actinopolymorpha alba]|uniref:NUDIX hydrolase n=1 Tax=Actinopolymorpha alba TaxID=533267 RepID=UPI000363572B|nr:NUDIX domain-containing protein [Actinopolymorpha alba]
MTGHPPGGANAQRSAAVVRRSTSRVLPVDPSGRVLLLHGFHPARPHEPLWFTVGGAIEAGESPREAASRELWEEVRIRVPPAAFPEPLAFNTVEFSWDGLTIVQEQTFFAVRVGDAPVSFAGLDEIERATTDGHRWWYADELKDSGEDYPEELPPLLRRAATLPAQ